MKYLRLLVSTMVLALAVLSLGIATAWLSDSGALHHRITAAPSFATTSSEVWVCKLVGPPDHPHVKEGKNPIHVSVDSVEAEHGFSDAHPSYVVDDGKAECKVPAYVSGSEETVADEIQPNSDLTSPLDSDGDARTREEQSPDPTTGDPDGNKGSTDSPSDTTGTDGGSAQQLDG
jgi:hypothetical protein